MKTIYVTTDKAKTIEKVKAKHPLIFISASQTEKTKQPQLIRLQHQHGNRVAFVLSPAEFAALPETILRGATVVRV